MLGLTAARLEGLTTKVESSVSTRFQRPSPLGAGWDGLRAIPSSQSGSRGKRRPRHKRLVGLARYVNKHSSISPPESTFTQTYFKALVISLLDQWKFDGFIRWTQGLQTQYTIRRDFIIDRFAEEFDLQSVKETEIDCFKGRVVYTAYPRSRSTLWMSEKSSPLDRKPLLSFIPPTSGMFVWVRVSMAWFAIATEIYRLWMIRS